MIDAAAAALEGGSAAAAALHAAADFHTRREIICARRRDHMYNSPRANVQSAEIICTQDEATRMAAAALAATSAPFTEPLLTDPISVAKLLIFIDDTALASLHFGRRLHLGYT